MVNVPYSRYRMKRYAGRRRVAGNDLRYKTKSIRGTEIAASLRSSQRQEWEGDDDAPRHRAAEDPSCKTKPIPRAEIASPAPDQVESRLASLLAMTGTGGEPTMIPLPAGSSGHVVQNKPNSQGTQ